MPKPEVHGSDYTDQEVNGFFDSVRELKATAVAESPPPELMVAAREFAAGRPRPTPKDMRLYIDHAVAVARGWDHPHDKQLMFHTAVKTYYTLAWLDYIQAHEEKVYDLTQALKVSFTPVLAMSR